MQNRFVNIFFSYLHTSGIIELMSNTLKGFLMIFNLNPAFINPKKYLFNKYKTWNENFNTYQHKNICKHKLHNVYKLPSEGILLPLVEQLHLVTADISQLLMTGSSLFRNTVKT